jgi:hypothetical protein
MLDTIGREETWFEPSAEAEEAEDEKPAEKVVIQ